MTRVSVLCSGIDAGAARSAARDAEAHGIDCFWLATHDDVYTMAALAAIAADTTDIRLGAVLNLRGSGLIVRLAELVGLVDQLSGGRLELSLTPAADPEWEDDAVRLVTARHGWQLPDGRTIALTPVPAQPVVPVLVGSTASDALLEKLGAGVLVDSGSRPGRRVALRAAPTEVPALRADLAAAGATELVLTVTPDQIRHAGVVLATGIRAGDHEAGYLTDAATRWFSATLDLASEKP